jgi:hypothetical protein
MDKKNLLSQANASVISTTTTKEKRNLVFMNNFYHKVAVTSVGVALGFALGTHKEAKAATFTFTETSSYHLRNQGELPDWDYTGQSLAVGIKNPRNTREEYRTFHEFNITNLSLGSNTVIRSAFLQADISNVRWYHARSLLQVYGYTENDKVDPLGVYDAGEYLNQVAINDLSIKRTARFNVLPFMNQRIGSKNSFAGFGIRFLNGQGFVTLDRDVHLIVTTTEVSERVPEPTTIFGSAIALSLAGWLKRKKSSQQNKITP